MKKYEVLCPHCCGVFFETNGRFRENKPANGSMFTAKQNMVDAGWSFFPLYDTTEYDNVVCPSCSQVLLDSLGKVLRLKEIGEVDEITDTPIQEIVKKTIDELMEEYEPELPMSKWNWKTVSSSLIIDISNESVSKKEIDGLMVEYDPKLEDESIRQEIEKKVFEQEATETPGVATRIFTVDETGIPVEHITPKNPGRPKKK